MEPATQLIFQIIILVFSVVIHEVSHGYAALVLGDKTAQYAGRLTLNPLKHLDPFGSIILPALFYFSGGILFGWAKPVPYNPYNLKNQKWGPAAVGIAGPAANLLLAVIFGLVLRFSPAFTNGPLGVFVFNFATLSGSIALLNLLLAFFNLMPIPPLDGSKVLFTLLPYRWRNMQTFLEQYGFIILLLFVFFFAGIIFPVIELAFFLITGMRPIF